ncbi:hypothetical protein NMG60_11020065 [Bertholletia excelsa]
MGFEIGDDPQSQESNQFAGEKLKSTAEARVNAGNESPYKTKRNYLTERDTVLLRMSNGWLDMRPVIGARLATRGMRFLACTDQSPTHFSIANYIQLQLKIYEDKLALHY